MSSELINTPPFKLSEGQAKKLEKGFEINYNILKQNFLHEKIAPDEVLKLLRKADQSTPDRRACIQNHAFLAQPEIQEKFLSSESKNNYYLLLAFTVFHHAQFATIQENNPEKALQLFNEALTIKQDKLSEVLFQNNSAYLEATISYFNQDLEGMRRYRDMIDGQGPEATNIEVINRLMSGLLKYGNVDYGRDYLGKNLV